MQMPGRNASTGDYRYGFQGQEKDDEVAGAGNSYTAEFWQYDSRLGRRWNVDPIVKEHESSYASFANNPIWFRDPLGSDTIANFDSDGQYTGWTDDGNEEWIGRWEKSEDETVIFGFADPVHDPESLESGEITSLIFVREGQVKLMIDAAGAFKSENKGSWSGFWYILEEGGDMGQFDFSFTQIKNRWPNDSRVSSNPMGDPSSVLFLVEGEVIAHNHMNFGNFLYGAGSIALKLDLGLILLGGHYNAYFNANRGFGELDSYDDQISISLGYMHGYRNNYSGIVRD
jgi:RHS repeat-associated protein